MLKYIDTIQYFDSKNNGKTSYECNKRKTLTRGRVTNVVKASFAILGIIQDCLQAAARSFLLLQVSGNVLTEEVWGSRNSWRPESGSQLHAQHRRERLPIGTPIEERKNGEVSFFQMSPSFTFGRKADGEDLGERFAPSDFLSSLLSRWVKHGLRYHFYRTAYRPTYHWTWLIACRALLAWNPGSSCCRNRPSYCKKKSFYRR